jgi:hypothetical protein
MGADLAGQVAGHMAAMHSALAAVELQARPTPRHYVRLVEQCGTLYSRKLQQLQQQQGFLEVRRRGQGLAAAAGA